MENGRNLQYAGNLEREIQEINKLLPEERDVADYGSATDRCTQFLTVLCC